MSTSWATFAAEFEAWLDANPHVLAPVVTPIADFDERVVAMRNFMGELFEAGWNRYGWPEHLGGLGGSILHRAAMWEALARAGVPSMAVFEHFEVLAPTLVAMGPVDFVAQVLPDFLSGRHVWSQGFSEPNSGSDLASLRTTARATDGGYLVTGTKIWTSWSKYATWCLVLARTGTPDSRHRGLTALIVDLRDAAVEVRPITQANGTDELAEVFFDDVFVPGDRVVGEVNGGWSVAMHILSHERGTYAWFRHAFLYQYLLDGMERATEADDVAIGNALLDLAAVSATGFAGVEAHATGAPLGPLSSYPKVMLCNAEQSVCDATLAFDSDLMLDLADDHVALRRQEYLFSRIVTVYGGSQQMQLDTIAKQLLFAMSNESEYLAVATRAVQKSGGSNALDALGWWDLLADVGDADLRLAVFALFRAHGAALASSAALGGLMAQPFASRLTFTPGSVVSTVRRTSSRRGEVHMVVGDVTAPQLLVDRPGYGTAIVDTVDVVLRRIEVPGRLPLAELVGDPRAFATALPETDAAPLRAQAVVVGRTALAMEMLGAADACVNLAIEYSGQREQFGQAIGSFQAVRHLLAWARTDVVGIESVARRAVAFGTDGPARFDEAVKALAGRNGRKACERALQVFGGIGFTAEHDHHHFHGRVLALDALLGTSADLTAGLGAWLRTERQDPRWASAILSS